MIVERKECLCCNREPASCCQRNNSVRATPKRLRGCVNGELPLGHVKWQLLDVDLVRCAEVQQVVLYTQQLALISRRQLNRHFTLQQRQTNTRSDVCSEILQYRRLFLANKGEVELCSLTIFRNDRDLRRVIVKIKRMRLLICITGAVHQRHGS